MVKLIIAAALALIGIVAGGIVAQVPDAPDALVALAGMSATAGAAVGGPAALARLGKLIPQKVRDEIVLYGLGAVALVESGQLAAFTLPAWLHVAIGVLVVVLGALGIRARATPLSNPRDGDGVQLVPSRQTTTSLRSFDERRGARLHTDPPAP